MKRDKKTDYSIIRYGISAGISFAIDFVIFAIMCQLLDNIMPSAHIIFATIIARVISTIVNYGINYRYVFRSQKGIRKTAKEYLILVVIQMCVSATCVFVSYTFMGANKFIAKVIVDTCIFFVNYIVQRQRIF